MAAFDILALIPDSPVAGKATVRVLGALDTYNIPRAATLVPPALTTAVAPFRITSTYNNAGVTFPGVVQNVVDTASNAASLLHDWQMNGVSLVSIRKDGRFTAGALEASGGNLILAGDVRLSRRAAGVLLLDNNGGSDFARLQFGGTTASFPSLKRSTTALHVRLADDSDFTDVLAKSISVGTAGDGIRSWFGGAFQLVTGNAVRVGFNSSTIRIASSLSMSWSAGDPSVSTEDLALWRGAANTLEQRNGVNPQAFRLYNTFTDASNYERGFFRWNANALEIGAEAAGTGSNRSLSLVASANIGITSSLASVVIGTANGARWLFNGTVFRPNVDLTDDIGQAASRVRDLFLGRQLSITGSTLTANTPALDITQTWNNAAIAFTGIRANFTDTASAAGSLLMDMQVGGATRTALRKDGLWVLGNSGRVSGYRADGTLGDWYTGDAAGGNGFGLFAAIGFGRSVRLDSTVALAWNTGGPSSGADLGLWRDAANTLAQRNGTNAQAFNIYNTWTDASNYERGFVRWVGNKFQIGTGALGTGIARDIDIAVGNGTLSVLTGSVSIDSARQFRIASQMYLSSPATGVALLSTNTITNGCALELNEFATAPAAPGANKVRIYAEDNGSGKTRLMAVFGSGAPVQIAIEP